MFAPAILSIVALVVVVGGMFFYWDRCDAKAFADSAARIRAAIENDALRGVHHARVNAQKARGL